MAFVRMPWRMPLPGLRRRGRQMFGLGSRGGCLRFGGERGEAHGSSVWFESSFWLKESKEDVTHRTCRSFSGWSGWDSILLLLRLGGVARFCAILGRWEGWCPLFFLKPSLPARVYQGSALAKSWAPACSLGRLCPTAHVPPWLNPPPRAQGIRTSFL